MSKNSLIIFISTALAFILLWLAIKNPSYTGDSGDSVMHYMFSKYAYAHPKNFLDHWAKPLFVLIASPFAQFGFIGIVTMNIFLSISIGYISCLIAQKRDLSYPMLVYTCIFFSPIFLQLVFSGLTEYLFAFSLVLSIYLYLNKKIAWSIILVSFLPFIRSEGLLMMPAFVLCLLIDKKYKYITLLAIGHIVYGIIGVFFNKGFLWTFTEIPYASLHSKYGKGNAVDFINSLMYCIEKPMIFLLCISTLSMIMMFFVKKKKMIHLHYEILVLGNFLVFFISHTIFWTFGIFHSMGLPRVLICVIPLIGLVCLDGLELIFYYVKQSYLKIFLVSSIIILIIIFPFTYRKKGIVWNKNLFVIPDNVLIEEQIKPFIKNKFPQYKLSPISSAHPYIALSLDLDIFDKNSHTDIYSVGNLHNKKNALIIWDKWSSDFEGAPKLVELEQDTFLKKEAEFYDLKNSSIVKFALFSVK